MKLSFHSGDRVFLILVIILTLAGLAIFSSAALGLLARQNSSVSRDILMQTAFGFGFGFVALFIARSIPLTRLKQLSPYAYGITLFLTLLVFVPGIGFHSGGATRWINLHFTTIQPAEFLKVGVVLALAWWLAPRARQLKNFKKGLLPFVAFVGIPALVLLMQPNTSTTLLILATGAVMYFAA
ncbi:MAG TPA: FtsW/RodA/SpoVE family cell cycle protein, partial [Candidatus Paceibacterota bacterium]|nr:FtsW/RodA/SpoVE family cell cycle protein [Candidatus Paceibacterota bacterium]